MIGNNFQVAENKRDFDRFNRLARFVEQAEGVSDGLFVAAAGAVARQHELDVVSNNLANVSTDGFRELRVSFETVLADPYNTQTNSQVYVTPVHTSTSQNMGPIHQTGNSLDVAIDGKGFFGVEGKNQELMYTRSGRFKLSEAGVLVTASGHLVQGESGTIKGLSGKVRIEKNGFIYNNGKEVGRLQIYDFDRPELLEREGALLFKPLNNQEPRTLETSLIPGALEGSNVNAIMAMTELVRVQRSFESSKKAIDAYRDMDRRLIRGVAG